jgi:hypothetical protein
VRYDFYYCWSYKSVVIWNSQHNFGNFREAARGAIITATESKTCALLDYGFNLTGTTTDAVVIAYENCGEGEPILYSGLATRFGKRVTKPVRIGAKDSLKTHYGSDDAEAWLLMGITKAQERDESERKGRKRLTPQCRARHGRKTDIPPSSRILRYVTLLPKGHMARVALFEAV